MRSLWVISAIIVAAGIFALQYFAYAPEFPPPPEPCDSSAIGPRDYSIYRNLLEEDYSVPRIADGATIFIPEATQVSERHVPRDDASIRRLRAEILESRERVTLSPDALSNFLRMSSDQTPFSKEQFDDLPIVLSSEREIDDVFENKGGWSALGVSTILRFSRIGFSCDRSQALLYRSLSCGRLCGGGDLVILEKDNNGWRAVLNISLWVS